MTNGSERVLVVAGGAVDEGQLAERLDLDEGSELKVVAPIESSDVDLITGEVDESIAKAEQRAEGAAADIEEASGARVVETESGEADPVQAIEDALTTFEADRIVLVADPAAPADWTGAGLTEEIRDRFALPVHGLES